MKGLLAVLALAAPGAAMAQDKAAMCVTVLQAMESAAEALDDMTDGQGEAASDLVNMRDRIGGADGAAVEAKALSNLDDYLAARRAVSGAIGDAQEALMAYCAP
jgi:hypothetical protein